MLTKDIYATYLTLLKTEMIPALGCTEPIAVALAAATAVKVLGKQPERAEMWCVRLMEGESNLYIIAKVYEGKDSAEVYIKESHMNIFRIVKNGQTVVEKADLMQLYDGVEMDRTKLNVRDILEFAETVDLTDVEAIIAAQIEKNTAISEEGLRGHYGVSVGRTLLKCFGNDLKTRAKARTAAGSDARMSGCSMPVVILTPSRIR